MKQRKQLRSQIINAWADSIFDDYHAKRINSERALQASLWAALVRQLNDNRRIFIEPSFMVSQRKITPDLVICNSRSVIAVIELKYQPRGTAKYAKDIRNLGLLARHRDEAKMSDARFRGLDDRVKSYPLASHVLFVWAGVHTKPRSFPDQLFSDGHPALNACFLELHAETTKGRAPEIYIRE